MFVFTIFLYFIVFLFNNNSFANLNNVINNNESFISKNNIETLINNNKNLSTRMRFFQYSKFFIGVHSLHSNNLQFETLYNFNQFDCITYIEILLALSISNTFEEFEKNILLIKYFNNKQSIELRRHFFISDFVNQTNNKDNELFKKFHIINVTKNLFPNIIKKRYIKIKKEKWFKKIYNINIEKIIFLKKNEIITLDYIDIKKFLLNKNNQNVLKNYMSNRNNNFLLITFRKNNIVMSKIKNIIKTETDISHVGILFKNNNNELILRHGSQTNEVSDVNFINYLESKKNIFSDLVFFNVDFFD